MFVLAKCLNKQTNKRTGGRDTERVDAGVFKEKQRSITVHIEGPGGVNVKGSCSDRR
jgi:hypothetical protein